jgi:hypothetical protein
MASILSIGILLRQSVISCLILLLIFIFIENKNKTLKPILFLSIIIPLIVCGPFLLNNVLTNRSLYAFLFLTAVASLLFDLVNYAVFALPWHNFLVEELKRLAVNFTVTIIIFYLITWLSYRLRPVFLIRAK